MYYEVPRHSVCIYRYLAVFTHPCASDLNNIMSCLKDSIHLGIQLKANLKTKLIHRLSVLPSFTPDLE